jgi:cytochrome c biogenesis factor
MWKPDERFFIKSHLVSSIATLVCGVIIIIICLVPTFFPDIYRLLVDDRISIAVPYLLFIALGGSIFSIWYFLFRKGEK